MVEIRDVLEIVMAGVVSVVLPLFWLWFRSEMRNMRSEVRLEISQMETQIIKSMKLEFVTTDHCNMLHSQIGSLTGRVDEVAVRLGSVEKKVQRLGGSDA